MTKNELNARLKIVALVFRNSMLPFHKIMIFGLSLKTESPTFLAVSITFLQTNRGGTFSKLQSSLKLFSFLESGAEASRASAFSLLTVLSFLSVASFQVTVLLPLKFLDWNLSRRILFLEISRALNPLSCAVD